MEKKLWNEAIKRFRSAIALYDRVRGNMDIVSLSANFLDDKYEAFPRIIQALAHVGKFREAYRFAEKYKAKGLMDTISEGRLRIQELVPDSIKNAMEEVQGKIEISQRELYESEQEPDPDHMRILSLEQDIIELELERASLLDRLKTKSSTYYHWMLSEPLSIEAVQREIIEPDDVIVEYVQGPEDLLVFLVTSDTLHYIELPVTRTEIDSMMRIMSPVFERKKLEQESPIDYPSSLQRGFSVHAAAELYDTLIRPIKQWIPEKGELIISPDDVLYYLPFDVLVADTGKMVHPQDYKRIRYLLSEHPLSYTPSASLLKLLMQKRRIPVKGLLALGNPDFDSIKKNATIRESPGGKSMIFPSLPNSEKEVFDLKSIVPFDGNTVQVGKSASEHLFKSEAGRYSIIHFATHFIIEEDRPLYSRIVLSEGDGEDGLLNAYEVYNLTLNANLVVLGGCESGVGTLHRGEGFIGLSRAFFYSGAQSILLSLWAVDDEATSTIMKDFYRALRSGMRKSGALRKAKLEYLSISDEERCDPFYWAPFVLLGQKGRIDFPNSKIRTVAIYLLIGMISLSSLAVIFHTARRNRSNRFTIIRSGDRSQASDL